MATSPCELRRPSQRPTAVIGHPVRKITFVPLASVSRIGHTVFRSAAPKAVWPVPNTLIHMSALHLRKCGIIKLEHLKFNGDPGVGFITQAEAEALRRHLGLKNLAQLSGAELVGTRDSCTFWSML